ncbi:hypothetical protein [Photobacterium damselae]|uniref:hypothetical protein n=1 Tax=Photobacterium damselae TaxID=38293 RepID=UPI001F2C542B|nr:hypothetical protein [Photobacterium damselae]UKA04470.1 hypothetical protein IHC89_22875 [Photobacterium damselae subsp. damselae]
MSNAIYWTGVVVLFICGVGGFIALTVAVWALVKEACVVSKRTMSHINFYRSIKKMEKEFGR